MERFDVAIVGAGSSGAAVADFAARAGMRVVVVDRRDIADAGARWVNDVPAWCFEAAGLGEAPDRVLGGPRDGWAVTLLAGWEGPALEVGRPAMLPIDMRALGAWLAERAKAAGAEFRGGVRVLGRERNVLSTDRGAIRADVLVDASGLGGANLLGLPPVPRDAICAAAQEVRTVRDPSAAHAFFARRDLDPRGSACFVAIHGGFSTFVARLHEDRVSLLAGSLPALGHPSGRAILDRFVAEQRWVGDAIFGGQSAIPLAPPVVAFAGEGVAHVGDSARQVFSAHGSGVGSGLVAARLLVDALVSGQGPRGYARAWMRAHGGLHFTYDLFRRFSATLDADDVATLVTSGLLDAESSLAAMEQRLPRLAVGDLPRKVGAFARAPRLVARLAKDLGRAPIAAAFAKAQPVGPIEGGWRKALARVVG